MVRKMARKSLKIDLLPSGERSNRQDFQCITEVLKSFIVQIIFYENMTCYEILNHLHTRTTKLYLFINQEWKKVKNPIFP